MYPLQQITKNVYHLLLSFVLFGSFITLAATPVQAPLPKQNWTFTSARGSFDKAALQRGFQVYREVCAACHSLKYISVRHLKALGFKEGQLKTIAKELVVLDGPNAEGKNFERPGTLADALMSPGRIQNTKQPHPEGAIRPDLSLMVKARVGGADYVYAILTGYQKAPHGITVGDTQYYNAYFPGNLIAMAPPLLSEGQVTYADGTKSTIEQMSHDVVTFLAWTAEPEMESRKALGFKVLFYLLIMSIVFYLSKRRIWSRIHK